MDSTQPNCMIVSVIEPETRNPRDMYGHIHLNFGIMGEDPRFDKPKHFYERYGDSKDAHWTDLRVGCQISTDYSNDKPRCYGWDINYAACSRIDLDLAERQFKTLARLDRAHKRLIEKSGIRPQTFGQYAAQVAQIAKAKIIYCPSTYGPNGFSNLTLPEGAGWIDHRVRKIMDLIEEAQALAA